MSCLTTTVLRATIFVAIAPNVTEVTRLRFIPDANLQFYAHVCQPHRDAYSGAVSVVALQHDETSPS